MRTVSPARDKVVSRHGTGRWRRPHWQLTALVAFGATLAVTLIGVALLRQHATVRELALVNEHMLPAAERLEDVTVHLNRAQVSLLSIDTADSEAVKEEELTAARGEATRAQAAWSDFRGHSVALPGEGREVHAFERAFNRYPVAEIDAVGRRLGAGTTGSTATDGARSDVEGIRTSLQKLRSIYEHAIGNRSRAAQGGTQSTERLVGYGGAFAVVLFVALFAVAFVLQRRRELQLAAQEAEHAREAERAQLEADLSRAFEMVETEEAAYRVIGEAIGEAIESAGVELKVADSNRAHFSQAVAAPQGYLGCPVPDPQACPTTSRTQLHRFARSDTFAACPYLRDEREEPCSAVCVPVTIAGKSVAVLHAIGRPGRDPSTDVVETLTLLGRKSGERLTTLRAFARTEAQARTDALTGLLNRRGLEDDVNATLEDGRPFVVAYGDIDHFKRLNDEYGHEMGDRALRLFARVLRESVRPADLVARYGGEEFLVVLPGCTVGNASVVVERLRKRLALQFADGRVPPFTVSFGVAAAGDRGVLTETIDAADAALLLAKAHGRDRVVIDGADLLDDDPTPGVVEFGVFPAA